MALMDSGIAMHHLFAAVSCAVTEIEEIILNPDELQINVRSNLYEVLSGVFTVGMWGMNLQ